VRKYKKGESDKEVYSGNNNIILKWYTEEEMRYHCDICRLGCVRNQCSDSVV
jgi:hypothetical protein